jgi:hypothetical protein
MARQPLFRQYIQQARRLARLDPRRPQQGNLRRAVSTAYYALFHFLIDQSSRLFVGSTGERESFRRVLVRAYGHSEMLSVARTFRGGTLPATITRLVGTLPVPPVLRNLAELFLNLQEQRHLADYDLAAAFLRQDVLALIDDVERAVADWATIRTEPAARFFLICLLVWEKIRNK